MSDPASLPALPAVIRFGVFELDLRAEELRRNGMRTRLQRQPYQILALLAERAGEIVTREEIRERLWPDGTFVDFDHSLNTAVKKLRYALADDAAFPRYVETIPRRGYRFIATLDSERSRLCGPALLKSCRAPEPFDSVAVLPFDTLGGGPETEDLADAITEAIINEFSRLETMRVPPRSTVFRYKGKGIDPIQAGCELRVRALLTGRVFQRGDDLIVAAELVDVVRESQLWGTRYNRKFADASLVRDEIAREACEELQRALAADEARGGRQKHLGSDDGSAA